MLPHSEERVSSSLSNAHEDVEKGGKTTVPIDDYNGPNDPLNPWNWPIAKRYLHIFPAAYCAFVATLGSSIYTPSYSEMMQIYGISTTVAILPMSLYVLSLSFGPMLFAPLSERYGRQVIFLTTLPLATLFTICGSFTTSFAAFCLCRFFSGFFFSPPIAVGAGCVTDLFPPEMRSKATVPTVLAPFLGPALGPVIGSYVTVAKGWKWVQYTMVLFALFGSLVCGLTDETHKGTILRRRNVTLGLPSPYPDLGKTRVERLRQWSVVVIWKPIDMLLLEPIVGFFSLYTAFNFGVLFMFFASFPYVFTTEYGFSKTENGLVFLSIAVGVFLGLPIVGICNKTLYMPKFEAAVQAKRDELSAGENTDSDAASIGSIVIAPEYRLYSAMIGSIILPIGLFWFAWTARSNITWVSPVLAAMPFAMGNLLIFISCCLYLADVYGMQGMASSLAANGVLRYVFGAAFPLFTLQSECNGYFCWKMASNVG